MNMIDFITARLDEDEQTARAAGNTRWIQPDPDRAPGRIESYDLGDVVVYDEGSPTEDEAAHIVRHDPTRVLRGVEAKRQLLDLIVQSLPGNCDCEAYGHHTDADTALRLLASEWEDHPDYQEAWAL